MSAIYLVRHGKASPLSDDYDKLSEIGFVQARRLGERWASRRFRVDAVFVGPRRRHAETLAEVKRAYDAAKVDWPDAVTLPALDEHDGLALVFKTIPRLADSDARIRSVADALGRGETPPLHAVLDVFKQVTRAWVRGDLTHHEVEGWGAFRARVSSALAEMAKVGAKKTIAAFTSAGAVAAAVGDVLGVSDEKVLELSWSLANGSVTEIVFSEERWGLRAFNATSHLEDAGIEGIVTSV